MSLSLFSTCKLFKAQKFKTFLTSQTRLSSELKKALESKIKTERERIVKFRKESGDTVIGKVTVNMVYGGMRGITGLVYETSLLDPEEGIRFRGLSIPECQEKLPKADCGEEPLPEGMFWLLLTGKVPTEKQAKSVSCEWADRSKLPPYIETMLKNFPPTLHPMSQFAAVITALNIDSKFVKAYNKGVKKSNFWESAYEDSMDIIAKLTVVGAHIYINSFHACKKVKRINPDLDWAGNFAQMIHYDDPEFAELMRLYLTIHTDHEGGNVSAHATHLVGSALSDPYLSLAAGMNGLAGPLHGLANQEVLIWLKELQKKVGSDATDEKIKGFLESTLKSGKVIPGYGHAVLRKTDPRFTCQQKFACKYLPCDELFQLVSKVYEIAPPYLASLGKVKNPWPNVDAHSGALLQYYGMTEMNYYTVLFGISRALGVLAGYIWARALGFPIERPKSLTTDALMKLVKKGKGGKGGKGGKK